jgi:hypothetical protein
MRLSQRLPEEPSGDNRISPAGEQKVDCLSGRIDGTVQIDPFSLDANVSLAHAPEPFVIRRCGRMRLSILSA